MTSQLALQLISGGQTGADRAALDYAIEHGLDHGGFCPKGRLAKDGKLDPRYKLTETETDTWSERTIRNVRAADATVIFSRKPLDVLLTTRRGSGSALTVRECQRAKKPFVVLSHYNDPAADAAELAVFLQQVSPRVLNVAGNAEDKAPGTYAHVLSVFHTLFRSFR